MRTVASSRAISILPKEAVVGGTTGGGVGAGMAMTEKRHYVR